jgi:hypothetical protein
VAGRFEIMVTRISYSQQETIDEFRQTLDLYSCRTTKLEPHGKSAKVTFHPRCWLIGRTRLGEACRSLNKKGIHTDTVAYPPKVNHQSFRRSRSAAAAMHLRSETI